MFRVALCVCVCVCVGGATLTQCVVCAVFCMVCESAAVFCMVCESAAVFCMVCVLIFSLFVSAPLSAFRD